MHINREFDPNDVPSLEDILRDMEHHAKQNDSSERSLSLSLSRIDRSIDRSIDPPSSYPPSLPPPSLPLLVTKSCMKKTAKSERPAARNWTVTSRHSNPLSLHLSSRTYRGLNGRRCKQSLPFDASVMMLLLKQVFLHPVCREVSLVL